MKNKSATAYRRLSFTRKQSRKLPDLPEMAYPRYQVGHTLTHRRGEKRMSKWLKFV